jgi:hypothetical protein
MVKNSKPNIDYEQWVPWIIGAVVVLIIFPYDKVKEYFTPEPVEVIKYVEVPVPQYIYIEKPEDPIPEPPPKPKEPIVCVFDIDNTITSGNPEKCIQMCKDLGCDLAINTSRDIDNPNDLDLKGLGFTEPYFEVENYYYNPNAKTSNFEDAASVKAQHMGTIQTKYSISDPKRVILFDDNKLNINRIEKDGFTGIHVGTKNPGIQDSDIEKAFNIIRSFE